MPQAAIGAPVVLDAATRDAVARLGQVSDLAAPRPLAPRAVAELLEIAIHDRAAVVRGAAWIMIADVLDDRTSLIDHAQLVEMVAAQLGCKANAAYKAPSATADMWLRIVQRLVGFARTSAWVPAEQAARTSDVELGDKRPPTRANTVVRLLRRQRSDSALRAALWQTVKRRENAPLTIDRLTALASRHSNSLVRKDAAFALGVLCNKTCDSTVMLCLANLVADDTEDERVRSMAYTSLLSIGGRSRELQGIDRSGGSLGIITQINWPFVASCILSDTAADSEGGK